MTTIKPQQFTSIPVRIEAVRVTAENMADVAKWCEGEVRTDRGAARPYIKVTVFRPMSQRQTMAFVGDWVTVSRTGNKVYLHQNFKKAFIEIVEDLLVVDTLNKADVDAVFANQQEEYAAVANHLDKMLPVFAETMAAARKKDEA